MKTLWWLSRKIRRKKIIHTDRHLKESLKNLIIQGLSHQVEVAAQFNKTAVAISYLAHGLAKVNWIHHLTIQVSARCQTVELFLIGLLLNIVPCKWSNNSKIIITRKKSILGSTICQCSCAKKATQCWSTSMPLTFSEVDINNNVIIIYNLNMLSANYSLDCVTFDPKGKVLQVSRLQLKHFR